MTIKLDDTSASVYTNKESQTKSWSNKSISLNEEESQAIKRMTRNDL
jgi:hypothetical protein